MFPAAGNAPALYLARGGVLAMNGNYSADILEGVAHFHPELVGFMSGRDARHGCPHRGQRT
jgi:hypothetical protein